MSFIKLTSRLLPAALLLGLQLPLGAYGVPLFLTQDFEKTYSETFAIGSDGDVRLDNRYGEIRVETWSKNEVSIEVRVKVSAEDKEDADDTFDRIRIDFSGSGNSASATTSIGDKKRSNKNWIEKIIDGDWSWGGSSSNDFKVYYAVKMPATANLTTSAKYCDVNLPDLSGSTNISIGYGDLFAGDLTGASNNLTVSYGSARIGTLGGRSEMRIRYSNGSINEAGDLRYDGRYSDFRLGDVGDLNLDIGYEDLEVRSAKNVRMDGNYSDIEMGQVTSLTIDGNYNEWDIDYIEKELDVDAAYGDLAVERIAADFTRINIDVRYIDVELDFDSDAGYEMDLSSRYGDISFDRDRVRNLRVEKSGSTETVSGTVSGKGNGRVKISTSYGDIELN